MSTHSDDRRYGRLVLTGVYRDQPSAYAWAFEGCVPMDVQHDWYTDSVTVTVWHPEFDAVEQGALIPQYLALNVDGERQFKRVK